MPKAVRDAQPQDVSVRVRAVAPLDVAYMQGPRALWSKGAVRLISMPLPAYECFRPLNGSAGAVSVHQSPESEAAISCSPRAMRISFRPSPPEAPAPAET